ncbi:MAG TPA: YidC/Oxa1 family membrane protein insertase [Candidatus Bathyarchaeia archaeon]|nr:YidC/Oxa1 family membrane protein insertase [Candidatus Bathyarchaeia archaeon]
MNLWFIFLYQPLINLLILFYQIFGQNLGLAIIGLTLAIRFALTPLTAPSMKAAQKMKELAPQLEKLKKKHKKDKQTLATAQMELYRQNGVNPAAGCLPQIIQIIILLALFQAFNQVLKPDGDVIAKLNEVLYSPLQLVKGGIIKTRFLYLNLTQPDILKLPFKILFIDKLPGIFLICSAAIQFFTSKMMMPAAKEATAKAEKTPQVKDDFSAAMQTQMLYMMPLMTLVIGFKFPSGLVLYWLTFSLYLFIQQLYLRKNGKNQKNNRRSQ